MGGLVRHKQLLTEMVPKGMGAGLVSRRPPGDSLAANAWPRRASSSPSAGGYSSDNALAHIAIGLHGVEVIHPQSWGLHVWSWKANEGLPRRGDQCRIWPKAQTVGKLVPPPNF